MVKLDKDRRGNDAAFFAGLEQSGAALVVSVVGYHRRD
jgi:hypothetical protein